MDIRCRIEMLGGLRVQHGAREITRFGTTKNGALLAHLAYHLDRSHPREVLAELLWPWSAPSASRRSLRVALASLRRQLEPPGVPRSSVLQADRSSVCLNRAVVETDVADFGAAVRAAGDADSEPERVQCLTEAVELYAGPLLPGYYQDWVIAAQEHVSDQYFQSVTALAEHLRAAGQLERAVEFAHRLAALDPLREETHLHLIRLLASAGQPDAARRQFRKLETILRTEFGEPPSPAAQQMMRALSGAHDRARQVEPQVRPAQAPVATRSPPQGTVTFLLADVDQGRELRRRAPEGFQQALGEARPKAPSSPR